MSASQEKKLRQQLREEGKDKRQIAQKKTEKVQKRRHVTQLVAGIVVAVVVIALFAFSSNLFYSSFTALKIGDTSYTAAEYSFFYKMNYNNFVNQYSSYISMIGLDTTKSLSSQEYTDGKTWADYFRESAQSSMKEMTALYDDAMKNGFELSDDDKTSLQSTLDSFETGYADAGYTSADAYIASIYGKGCNLKTISALIEKYYIAQSYATQKNNSLTYTDDQLKAYYEENKDDLDNYTYISYFADGSVKDDASAEAGTASAAPDASASPSASPDTEAETAAAMASAKAVADAIVADGKTADEFKQAVLAETQTEASDSTTQGSSLTDKYADWLKDASRKEGDSTVIEADTGYYAVYFISRDDNNYKTVDVRHILVKAVASEDGTYSDEAKATAKQKAEDLLAEWQTGDKTEDSFAILADNNSEDTGSNTNGGLYENVYKDQMVAEFNDWCFDETRKTGDTGIVYGETSSYSGYHVVYYVGEGELYSNTLAEDGLRSKDFSAWKEALLASYEVKTGLTASLVK